MKMLKNGLLLIFTLSSICMSSSLFAVANCPAVDAVIHFTFDGDKKKYKVTFTLPQGSYAIDDSVDKFKTEILGKYFQHPVRAYLPLLSKQTLDSGKHNFVNDCYYVLKDVVPNNFTQQVHFIYKGN